MNKLKTNFNGGFPFVLDDLRWMDASYREAFKKWTSAYGNNYIVSGCNPSLGFDNNLNSWFIDVSEGAVVLNGELLSVPPHQVYLPAHPSALPPGEGVYFVLDVIYYPSGTKTLQNGNQVDTYEIRQAKLIYGTLPQNYLSTDSTRLFDIIGTEVVSRWQQYQPDKTFVGTLGAPSFLNSWQNGQDEAVHFIKLLDGTVWLGGKARRATSVIQNTVIFNLPAAYRPTRDLYFVTQGRFNGQNNVVYPCTLAVTIQASGDVFVERNMTDPPRGFFEASLNGISYIV